MTGEEYTAPPLQRTTGITRAVHCLYGVYAISTFFVCAMLALAAAACIPGLERRRRGVAASARLWFVVAGIRSSLAGLSNLPAGHCIVVANHASYLDGVILQAYLPPRFSFVIKGEMKNVPLAGFLLRRIGSRFVERFVASRSSRGARDLLRAAAAGESLAVFPEGTFIVEAGLQRFRPGAFAAAIKGRLPVVPVAVRGSRHILPSRRVLPRRGPLRIDILPPIEPGLPAFGDSRSLARAARQRLLARLDEPDLDRQDGRTPPAGRAAAGLQSNRRCE